MFSPDQLVVYPAQGVGVIERLETKKIGEHEAKFYIIKIITNGITVLVPVANAKNIGLRKLCTAEEAARVLESFANREAFTGYTGQNWNRRYREYSERLKTSLLEDASHVLKELILISGSKDLSFGERRLLEQSMTLVTSEIALVLEKDIETIKAHIESHFEDILKKPENTD